MNTKLKEAPTTELSTLAREISEIVAREENDHYVMGEKFSRARNICDDVDRAAAEGVVGKTGAMRFNQWINSGNLPLLKPNKRAMCMRLYNAFGVDNPLVANWKPSIVDEILRSKATAHRADDIVKAHQKGLTIKEIRAILAPPAANDAGETPVDNTPEPTAEVTQPDSEWEQVLELAGTNSEQIETALEAFTNPGYMVAKGLEHSKAKLLKELALLSKPDRKRTVKAVVQILTHNQEVFSAEIKMNLRGYNKDLQLELKAELKKQKQLTMEMRKLLKTKFDKKDFRFIRGVLHSDRPVADDRRDKAFDLFLKLAPLFAA